MDIAVGGLASIALPDPGRFRSRPAVARADVDPQNTGRNRNTTQTDRPRTERIIRGEVLSSSTEQNRRQNSLNQSDTRQLSRTAAIQTYRDNQALIVESDQPRQVSGIIDEYV